MRNLDTAIRHLKQALGPQPQMFVSQSRLSEIYISLKLQVKTVQKFQGQGWFTPDPARQEAQAFLDLVLPLLTSLLYDEAVVRVWRDLQTKHITLMQKWQACKEFEHIKCFVLFSRLETLSQLMQMLLRRPLCQTN